MTSSPFGAVDDDVVRRAVAAAAAAARLRFTSSTSVPVRSFTVMVSAPPRALKSMLSTSLRSIMTLATLRKNDHAPAVGRDVDVLADVGAVEEHRVEAGLAFEGVVVVAGIPDEDVVAGAHEGRHRCRRRR